MGRASDELSVGDSEAAAPAGDVIGGDGVPGMEGDDEEAVEGRGGPQA